MRIGIIGVAGRMGRLLAEEARAAGHEVSGGLIRLVDSPDPGVPILPDLTALAACSDVVIDFTIAAAAAGHAATLAEAGTAAWVLGTTGLSAADEAAVAEAATRIPVVYAANFSPGVTLLLELARPHGCGAARPNPTTPRSWRCTIARRSMRHPAPPSPSGAPSRPGAGWTWLTVTDSGRDGHTGPREHRRHRVRCPARRPGGGRAQRASSPAAASRSTLTHRAFDRRVFAAGAIRAAGWVHGRPPGLYGMADVMA